MFVVILLILSVGVQSFKRVGVDSVTLTVAARVEVSADSDLEWNKTYGGTSDDEPWASVQTLDGGYALAGSTYSFGAGSGDVWLVRTDETGNMLWNRTYGGTGNDTAYSMIQTGDGGYALAGSTYSYGAGLSDFWLVKTDSNGNALWNRTYGGASYDNAHSVVQTIDGGYALVGIKYSSGVGNWDVWLVRTDALGNMQWNKTYGGTSNDGARFLVQTSDGGYAMTGSTVSFAVGLSDFWLIKTGADGNTQWIKTYGGTDWDDAYSVIQTADGGYALVGCSFSFGAGAGDVWLVKTDVSGNHLWNRTYGGTSEDRAYSMVQTVDGGYALVGYTYSFGAGDCDVWFVKTSTDGSVRWNQTYGGTGEDYARSMVKTSDGDYALAGRTASFGAGNGDFWLVKPSREPLKIIVPDDCSTIQEAINNAIDGDTVFVKAGTYFEHVIVNKPVTLVGEDVTTTIIDGSETGRVIDIVSDNVSVAGFTVQRSGNIALPDLDAGICLNGTRGCTISGNNIVHNGGIGVHLLESSQNTVSGNNLTDNGGFAISLTVSSDNVVSSNLAVFNRLNGIGIHALSHNNVISDNFIVNSTCHGFMLNNVRNCTISGNYLANNSETGMWLQADSINNTICDNVFAGNRYGISIEWADGNIVSGNTLMDGQLGIQILNAEYTEILNNTITNNYGSEWDAGIRLDSAGYTRIFCNNITDNWRAILLYNASPHVSIINNNISCNEFGVRMRTGGSGYMNMSGNIVMSNRGYGIGLSQYSDYNTITQNNIGMNEYGLFTEYSTHNTIYWNNFVNNTGQVYVGSGSINTWDKGYPSGGNYWSNYTGLDQYGGPYQNLTGSDGIGDALLILDGNNSDRYPLMTPWTEAPSLIGDVNADGKVDMKDVGYVARRFMCVPGDPLWDVNADLNGDEKINMVDIGTVARHFGESVP